MPGHWSFLIDNWTNNSRQPTRIYDVFGGIKLF